MANEDINEYRRLEELGGSDYEMVDGDPNIKGWDIKDSLGAKLGEVDELLFNPATQKIRYIVALLEARVFGIENRKVLIPVGLAELHEHDDDVYLPAITIPKLAAAPDYIRGSLTFESELAARNAFIDEPVVEGVYDDQTFYEHDHFNERNFYGRRFTGRETPE